jgi:hypothetical protein
MANTNTIIPHLHREDVRAVFNSEKNTIAYEYLLDGKWVLDYTASVTDRNTWFYDGSFGAGKTK